MNKAEALSIVFDVLNKELIKPRNGSDTIARAIVYALYSTSEEEPEQHAPAPPERHKLIGFQIIGEMTHDDLIEECIDFQSEQWRKATPNMLKQLVIQARLHRQKERLETEAKLEPEGLFGFPGMWQ